MKLSTQDAELFFQLMWSVQFFVNQQLKLLADVKTLKDYQNCTQEQKMIVRQALYDNLGLIDSYLKTNPQNFSNEKLSLIENWKHCVVGDFYIERLLKKYAIFIANDNSVYKVLALHDSFQSMFGKHLPMLIKTTLLPFKGKIIYDGLLQFYNVFFGSGISYDLKESYMTAKQNGRIIENLKPSLSNKPQKSVKPEKDWRPELDELVEKAKKLRSSAGAPTIHGPVFRLLKASLELAQTAVYNPADLDKLWKLLEKTDRALTNVETTLYRSEH